MCMSFNNTLIDTNKINNKNVDSNATTNKNRSIVFLTSLSVLFGMLVEYVSFDEKAYIA